MLWETSTGNLAGLLVSVINREKLPAGARTYGADDLELIIGGSSDSVAARLETCMGSVWPRACLHPVRRVADAANIIYSARRRAAAVVNRKRALNACLRLKV